MPQRRGDVVGGGAGVAERRDVEVDLRRRGVLHRRAEAGAELLLDRALELDRVQSNATQRVGERALAVVGGHQQGVLTRELRLEEFDEASSSASTAFSITPSHFEPMP